MAENLLKYAMRYSAKEQFITIMVTLLSLVIVWASLQLPKTIVDDAIRGTDFPRVIFGFEFEQIGYLLLLCSAYFVAISLNNGVKFVLNLRRGIVGERMLRRMRFELFSKVMNRPLDRLRATSSGEIVQLLSAELAPIGDFVGAVLATPVAQGGMFLVYLVFICVQDPLLGVAAISLYPVQGYIVRRLQLRVVASIRERLANLRATTREIGDSIDGAVEIRALRTSRWHRAVISDYLFTNYKIRRRIFILKFLMKFTNNVANHLTPFFFYMIGGYFVIEGRIEMGALLAVLVAYKDLAAPWKELLAFYQSYSDMSSRFAEVIDQFAEDAEPVDKPVVVPKAKPGEAVALSAAKLPGFTATVNVHAPLGALTAVFGEEAMRRTTLLQALAGVLDLEGGKWCSANDNINRATALVTNEPRVFAGSIRDNILHGMRWRPVEPPTDPAAAERRREAELTGSTTDDVYAQWVDPTEIGYGSMAEVDERMLRLAREIGMEDDIYRVGLNRYMGGDADAKLVAAVLDLRKRIASDPSMSGKLEDFVDVWDPEAFNRNGTVADNLIFARPSSRDLTPRVLAGDRAVVAALDKAGITDELITIGLEICEALLELFEAVGGESDLLAKYNLFSKSDAPHIEKVVRQSKRGGARRLRREDRARMIAVAMSYCSARHRLDILSQDDRRERIVEARPAIREALKNDARLHPFDRDEFNPAFTVLENLLFGPVRIERSDAWAPFAHEIDELIAEAGLRDPIVRAGLDQDIGDGGVSLNNHQRRSLALTRGLLKNPTAILIDGMAGGPSEEDRRLRTVIRREIGDGAVVIGTSSQDMAREADHVIWLGEGKARTAREGAPRELEIA